MAIIILFNQFGNPLFGYTYFNGQRFIAHTLIMSASLWYFFKGFREVKINIALTSALLFFLLMSSVLGLFPLSALQETGYFFGHLFLALYFLVFFNKFNNERRIIFTLCLVGFVLYYLLMFLVHYAYVILNHSLTGVWELSFPFLINRRMASHLMVVLIPLLFMLVNSSVGFRKIFSYFLVWGLIYSIIYTGGRGAILSLFIVGLVIFRFEKTSISFILISTSAIAVNELLHYFFLNDVVGSGSLSAFERGSSGRIDIWIELISNTNFHSPLGGGLSGYRAMASDVMTPHNLLLNIFYELGWVGVIFFVIFIYKIFVFFESIEKPVSYDNRVFAWIVFSSIFYSLITGLIFNPIFLVLICFVVGFFVSENSPAEINVRKARSGRIFLFSVTSVIVVLLSYFLTLSDVILRGDEIADLPLFYRNWVPRFWVNGFYY